MRTANLPNPYLINLLWKLGLGLGLDLQLRYFRIFRYAEGLWRMLSTNFRDLHYI